MEALNEVFPVILYGLLIILVVVLIILVVKLIKTISKVDLVVDDVNLKVKKLDGVFNIVDNITLHHKHIPVEDNPHCFIFKVALPCVRKVLIDKPQ